MKLRQLAILSLVGVAAQAQRPSTIPPGPRGGGPSGGPNPVERIEIAPGPIGRTPLGAMDHRPGPTAREVQLGPRPGGAPPVQKLGYFKQTQRSPRPIIYPPAWPRCMEIPDAAFWGRRDLMAEIQWLSRAGFLPVTPVDPAAETVVDHTWMPSGWKAYGIAVPPGGKLQVEVQHAKLGWFRLMAVDRWGKPGPGMLQAAIAHRPVLVTVTNPSKKPDAVYIIVDDPGWWSDKNDPYTLVIRRDWDPATVNLSSVTMVAGLWGASPSVSAQFRGPSLTGPAVFPH